LILDILKRAGILADAKIPAKTELLSEILFKIPKKVYPM
jgi:hypothetical protein